jgi:hypothetical protein
MADLIAEAAQMPDAAIQFAQGVGFAGRIPDRLVPLRHTVLAKHKAELAALNAALDRRFGQPNEQWMGAFRAAALDALTAHVGRQELEPGDQRLLRQLWDALLAAR